MRLFALVAPLACLCAVGCGRSNLEMQSQALQEKATELVKQGFSQGARTTQFQAGLQGINPGYVFDGEVIVGTCVKVYGVVRLDGVSGQIQAASQTDADIHVPTSQPSN